MKTPLLILTLLFILLSWNSRAQSYDKQRTRVFLVNSLSNAVIGGIGGAINHKHSEKWHTAFARNFLKGGAGGMVKYTAKYQVYNLSFPQFSMFAPIDRMWFFLGHSMVMNAAYNRPLLERLYCNFYGVDIRYDSKAEHKVQARASLATLEGLVEYAAMGYELNLYRTLEYGIFMFDARGNKLLPYYGQARFNCVVLREYPGLGNLPHEMVHVYQLYDYFPVASFYDKKARSWYESKKLYKSLSKYVTLDHESLFMTVLYLPQFRKPPHYYKNYFEFEAEHFGTRYKVAR